MKQLYYGELSYKDADAAINEFHDIKESLKKLDKKNHKIIWDGRNLAIEAPQWAINPNVEVVSLANYYVTVDGRDLIDIFILALNDSKEQKKDIAITSLAIDTTFYY